MFTGIVKGVGVVKKINRSSQGVSIAVSYPEEIKLLQLGESISVNGCCLTVTCFNKQEFEADIGLETLLKTTFDEIQCEDLVNLELPITINDRLGGHMVQGHIDQTGVVLNKTINSDGSANIEIKTAPSLLRYVIEKGSICVDGVSLTVINTTVDSFSFMLIPHTLMHTILGLKVVGSRVNLEVDCLAKYVEKLLNFR